MPSKHPIQYDLTPRTVEPGMSWVTLTLENVGEKELGNLAINLYSADTYCVMVVGTGAFVPSLAPGEAASLPFQISAQATGELYVSLDGRSDGEPFHWESPDLSLAVGGQPAELVSFVALKAPRARLGEPLVFEATVRGLVESANLVVEFWVETPEGEFLSLAKEGLGILAEDEVMRRTVEFAPEEEGLYLLHAYLYQGARRIGHKVEYLSITLQG